MKWNKKKRFSQWLGVFVSLLLIIGNLIGMKMTDQIEPVNPIAKECEKLECEVLAGGGAFGQLESDAEQEEEQEEEEQTQGKSETQSQKETQEPENSRELENPSESEQSNEAENPNNPKEPGERENSGESNEPGEPDEPGESDEPGEPSDPGEPDEPGEPSNPGKPGDLGEPDEPGEPSDPGEPDEPGEPSDPGDENAGLVTDLQSKIITVSEIENDTLGFYAYYSDATVAANIRVNYKHEEGVGNGTWLTASGRDYSCKLSLGKNVITIYYDNAKGERKYSSFTITYQADKATEDNPEVGDELPEITTNLDDWTGEINTQNFTFTVSARTGAGAQIYSNHIQVLLDGETITNPTGNSTYEYVLYFKKPLVGETEEHKITVLAWDDVGNSKMVVYHVTYRSADEGEVIGQVRVVVDATTVGVGVLADEMVDIIQGKPASYILLAALEQMGFEYEFAGTEMIGFYIRSVSRGNAFKYAAIPEELLAMIQKDEIEMREPCTRNQLGEYDFTQGSGWLYSVNGGNYAGKGLSEWYLNDGDTLYMRFTLAYGKDVGGSDSEFGKLNSYCGMWIDGGYIQLEHAYVETERGEPTETEEGYVEYCCSNCQHTYREVLPCLTPTGISRINRRFRAEGLYFVR